MQVDALKMLKIGALFPFDASDAWRNGDGSNAPAATDWAHAAARGILADLTDRDGIGEELDQLDEDVRAELIGYIADIIRDATNSPATSMAATGRIMAELLGRRGVGNELAQLGDGQRVELAGNMLEIIRTAAANAR